ncbi:MAG: hypothetical protein H7337_14160 [Rhizobacter sp.]|nr:hypothetical protein [Rhizobacter sp.]
MRDLENESFRPARNSFLRQAVGRDRLHPHGAAVSCGLRVANAGHKRVKDLLAIGRQSAREPNAVMSDIDLRNADASIVEAFSQLCSAISLNCDRASDLEWVDFAAPAGQETPMRRPKIRAESL